MARRRIGSKTPPLVRTTIHDDLYQTINNFRVEYMKMNGRFINNSQATKLIAKKLSRIKPPRLEKIRRRKIDLI